MSELNVELVRETFEAFAAGGFEAMLPFFPADVVWYPAPGWVEDAEHRGHAGVRRMAAVWTESFDDLSLLPCDLRDLGDTVLALAESTARVKNTDVEVRQPYAMVYSGFRDGTVREVRFFFSWEEALESVGLQQ